jgi:hypothetical protein
MDRKEVYKLISGERHYQNYFWSHFDDSKWKPADWINFMKSYIREAEEGTNDATTHADYELHQMTQIRKIAALAVAAMEYNETKPRL